MSNHPSPPPSPEGPPPAPPAYYGSQLADYHNTQKSCLNADGEHPANLANEWYGTEAEARYKCANNPECVAIHDWK